MQFETTEIIVMAIAGVGLTIFLVVIFLLSIIRYNRRVKIEAHTRAIMEQKFSQELLQVKLETQEEIYSFIAQELHDNVGQLLSTANMLINISKININRPPESLSNASDTITTAIKELRYLSKGLDKDWISRFSLLENLNREAIRINTGSNVLVDIDSEINLELTNEEQLIVFRIIQEAIQNAIKHAEPSNICIKVEQFENVIIKVINDGKKLNGNIDGMGVKNMKYRTELLKGSIQWSDDDHRTVVTLKIPLRGKTPIEPGKTTYEVTD